MFYTVYTKFATCMCVISELLNRIIHITTLIIQDIWRDCIKPPEKHSAFNIEIRISRNTK